jgi:hypothetical protein
MSKLNRFKLLLNIAVRMFGRNPITVRIEVESLEGSASLLGEFHLKDATRQGLLLTGERVKPLSSE